MDFRDTDSFGPIALIKIMTNIVPNDITVTTVKMMLMISSKLMIQLFLSKYVKSVINAPMDKTNNVETKVRKYRLPSSLVANE